ncbi:hypothetical protein JCM19241_5419 [Vibrio ishigakensis]|uniref:Peptidase M14 domain-containing protein n=1 Tax=Vibrio ishigakensis TaxID=1481914 RepID=A0A0B8QGE5_9VIBR|nr:hypothetical protein JCM19241_5419 [Vibrio ishigakensis]
MTILFDKKLVDPYQELFDIGQNFEAWIFADRSTRQVLEDRLSSLGIQAKIYSSYKPLVHFFIESDVNWSSLAAIKIGVPEHPMDPSSRRFLLETYPLKGLYPNIEFYSTNKNDATYVVSWEESESKQVRRQVFAPNHIHKDHIDQEHCSATGWIKTEDGKLDKRFETPYESLFWQSMLAIVDHEFVPQEPLFERLNIEVELPFKDTHLAFGNEIISLREALHEEYYFSLLEWVQVLTGKPSGSRDIRPGQIVPNIRYGENYKVRVMLENYSHSHSSSFDDYSLKDLDKCSKPLELSQVNSALKSLMSLYQGEKFEGQSILGETIQGALFNDENPSVSKRGALITGAQHANETTGVVGLLRASSEYLSQTERHPLAIIPVHNVDGYKLYHELLEDNTYHMHHAARYSAHGNDVEYQQPQEGFERAARDKGLELADAVLHLNLHGYPAHEWTRPLTGYIPKNFDLWSIPKGFF